MYKDDQGRNMSAAAGKEKGSVATVSSESSLDSFIMGLPAAEELPKFATRQSSERQRQQSSRSKPEIKLPTFTRPSHTHIANTSAHSIPDFLYQLTKMLADENTDIIEWNNAGRIEVHNPHRLENEVLHKYFRHSKFASLQRQLNYFGFRKLAGKGKMAPCSYINEAARGELSSLIYIKRRGSVSGPEPEEKSSRRKPAAVNAQRTSGRPTRGNPALIEPPTDTSTTDTEMQDTTPITSLTSQQALAKFAAGRGIRHGWSAGATVKLPVDAEPHGSESSNSLASADTTDDRLSQLERNYTNCINNSDHANSSSSETDPTSLDESSSRPAYGFLSRNSSLVDLAMIPEVEEEGDPTSHTSNGLTFVDFPNVHRDDSNSNEDCGGSGLSNDLDS